MRTKGLCLPVSRFIFGRNEFVEDDSDRVIRDFYLTYFGTRVLEESSEGMRDEVFTHTAASKPYRQ